MGTQWLDEHRNEAFFLFLHFWDPHIPYLPPQSYKSLYAGCLGIAVETPSSRRSSGAGPRIPCSPRTCTTTSTSSPVWNTSPTSTTPKLRISTTRSVDSSSTSTAAGLLDQTMVVLFGDHGENMTEHDAWFDHAGLYDSVVHVPVIIWAPGVVPESEVTALISTVDVKPTVLDFLRMPAVEGLDGRSLRPLMERKRHRSIVTQSF